MSQLNACSCFLPALSPYDRNVIWRVFTRPPEGVRYAAWVPIAQKVLAEFRAEIARYADDAWLKQLIADLQRISPEFRDWWPRYDVRGYMDTTKEFEHPVVGRLVFEHTTLQVPTNPDLKIMIYLPKPGTDTASKMQQLLETETTVSPI